MGAVLDVVGLSKTFRRRLREPGVRGALKAMVRPTYETLSAVRDLSLSMDPGDTLALIGPNGAGKSTTVKVLTGIMHPSAGAVRVLGLVPWKDRTTLCLNIATVFGQRSQLWYHLPAGETFELLASIYELPRADYQERLRNLTSRFDLGPLLQSPVRQLSLGQRMRCEIAASLLHRPRVLFLDEPTIGLDVIAKQEIRALIRELNRQDGVAVLLTSHDAGDIEQLCERATVINDGTAVYDGTVATLKRSYLGKKVVQLTALDEKPNVPELAGVHVLERNPYQVRLEVSCDVRPIAEVMAALSRAVSIADITIEDPPMEEIIAAMYRDQAASTAREASA